MFKRYIHVCLFIHLLLSRGKAQMNPIGSCDSRQQNA